MKKTIVMEQMQVSIEIEGNGRTVVTSVNPILEFGGKRYAVDVTAIKNNDGSTFSFSPFKIGTANLAETDEARIVAEFTRYLLNDIGSLFLYGIREEDGAYKTKQKMKFFKDTVEEQYLVIIGDKSFYVNEKSPFIKRTTQAEYSILVALEINSYQIEKRYERTIAVRGSKYFVSNTSFATMEEANIFALKSIFDSINLKGTEPQQVKVRKKKKYINVDSPEFIAVAKKYEAGKIGYLQASAKLDISTAGFGRKMQEYRNLKEVAATK